MPIASRYVGGEVFRTASEYMGGVEGDGVGGALGSGPNRLYLLVDAFVEEVVV